MGKLKNFLKKILPPPVNTFRYEIERVIAIEENNTQALTHLIQQQNKLIEQNQSAIREILQLSNKNAIEPIEYLFKEQHKLLMALSDSINAKNTTPAPRIAIAVAAYNVEDYLATCLDSLLSQTYENIEIICVNDGSTDQTGSILADYAKRDSRIKPIQKEKNEGLMLARKSAVEAATADHIIFVDADDYLHPGLCLFVNDLISSYPYDIMQFGAKVDDYSNNEDAVKWLTNALRPNCKLLLGSEIIEEAYIKRSYSTVMWGKVYKTSLCRTVYGMLPDKHFYVGEDILTFFFLSYFAQSYRGFESDGYYIYRYGLGVGNGDIMSLNKYKLYCQMGDWAKYAWDSVIKDETDTTIIECYHAMCQRMLKDCCNIYSNRLNKEDQPAGLELIRSHWNWNESATIEIEKIALIS